MLLKFLWSLGHGKSPWTSQPSSVTARNPSSKYDRDNVSTNKQVIDHQEWVTTHVSMADVGQVPVGKLLKSIDLITSNLGKL